MRRPGAAPATRALPLAAAGVTVWLCLHASPVQAQPGQTSAGRPAAAPSRAQPADARPPRVDVAVGVKWDRGGDRGTREASLTGGGIPHGGEVVLFRADTRQASAAGIAIRAGVRVTGGLVVEGGAFISRPSIDTTIRDDVEQPEGGMSTARLREFVFDGGLRYEWRPRAARLRPFVRGSLGYLRQLSDDRTVVEAGLHGEVGGGVFVPLVRRARGMRAAGLRADIMATLRRGGFDVDDTTPTRAGVALGVAAFVAF